MVCDRTAVLPVVNTITALMCARPALLIHIIITINIIIFILIVICYGVNTWLCSMQVMLSFFFGLFISCSWYYLKYGIRWVSGDYRHAYFVPYWGCASFRPGAFAVFVLWEFILRDRGWFWGGCFPFWELVSPLALHLGFKFDCCFPDWGSRFYGWVSSFSFRKGCVFMLLYCLSLCYKVCCPFASLSLLP